MIFLSKTLNNVQDVTSESSLKLTALVVDKKNGFKELLNLIISVFINDIYIDSNIKNCKL